jgi:hypothetical protein
MEHKFQTRLDNDAQLAGTIDQQHAAQIEGRLKDLHTCLPGIVVSFDAGKQTATVQPTIKRVFTSVGAVNLPVCVDVPVAFPGGGDFFLTFPVKAGDECILLFSERAIDYWYQQGGTQSPSEYRLHDLSDGIAIVGLNSQPHKLTSLQTSGAELRTRDRSTYIRLENGTVHIKGNVQLEGDLTQTGNTNVTGTVAVTQDVTANGTSLHTHKHSGVQAGGAQTGAPV